MESKFKQFSLEGKKGKSFILTPIELKDFVDFEVRRVYYLRDFKEGAIAGQHSHKEEKEFFIVQQGSAVLTVDYGQGKREINLKASDAIYVGNYVWHGFINISDDAIILALSSTNYNPDRSDYISEYEEFKKIIQ